MAIAIAILAFSVGVGINQTVIKHITEGSSPLQNN